MQSKTLLHFFDRRETWYLKLNESGHREWVEIKLCPAALWIYRAARQVREDYRVTCIGTATLDGYRAYLRRACLREINSDPSTLAWFDHLSADAWTRRKWMADRGRG